MRAENGIHWTISVFVFFVVAPSRDAKSISSANRGALIRRAVLPPSVPRSRAIGSIKEMLRPVPEPASSERAKPACGASEARRRAQPMVRRTKDTTGNVQPCDVAKKNDKNGNQKEK